MEKRNDRSVKRPGVVEKFSQAGRVCHASKG